MKPYFLKSLLSTRIFVFLAGFCLIPHTGCIEKKNNEVRIYSALDRQFSEPVLRELETKMDLTIRCKFDQESNKTVGLVTSLIQNRAKPQADIFWNNEILHTIRLQNLNLLEAWVETPTGFPDGFNASDGTWQGFAARARVLLINTERLVEEENRPNSVYDLAKPKWRGRCAIARPLFGTTATHAAALLAHLGESEGKRLLTAIAKNAVVVGGNKNVAQGVARGQFDFGLTDTDDAIIELENGAPVALIFPDQGAEGVGTLLIPNTIGILKNGPNPERAKRLALRLVSADIENRLAKGPSAQIPLHESATINSRVEPTKSFKTLKVDFEKAAECWNLYSGWLNETFPLGQ